MDFRLTDEQQQLRDTARRYAREKLVPIAEEIERSGEPPTHALIHEYAEMGFLGINIPARLGGMGLGSLEALIVLEQLARISSAVPSATITPSETKYT